MQSVLLPPVFIRNETCSRGLTETRKHSEVIDNSQITKTRKLKNKEIHKETSKYKNMQEQVKKINVWEKLILKDVT